MSIVEAKASTRHARLPVTIWTDERVELPAWVVDHASYRHWARSAAYPRRGRFAFLDGNIWMDLSMEQVFSHNAVKTRITTALDQIVFQNRLGRVFSDRLLLSNLAAGLSTESDACFVSYESLQGQRVRYVEGEREGVVELEGTPDMTLEVVSTSSVKKDTITLRKLYWKAGVREYWLVDARQAELQFTILQWTADGYLESRRLASGWTKSTVFGRSFRSKRSKDPLGDPLYNLEMHSRRQT